VQTNRLRVRESALDAFREGGSEPYGKMFGAVVIGYEEGGLNGSYFRKTRLTEMSGNTKGGLAISDLTALKRTLLPRCKKRGMMGESHTSL